MALRKLFWLALLVFLPIISAESTPADPSLLSEDVVVSPDQTSVAVSETKDVELELRHLKSKLYSLEIRIQEKKVELERKDGDIKQLEKVIEEKSDSLASLQSSLRLLQEKGSLSVKERVGEVNTRIDELEKQGAMPQIINLRKEIQGQDKKKEELEAQADVAEKKIERLNLKFDNLHRINEEQKTKILKTQRALEVAEEEMLKAKLETSSVTEQLKEVHQVWLPPWLSAHILHCQSFCIAHWNEHGKPVLDVTIQKALKQKAEVEKWVQPHFETLRTKWFPTIKERSKAFVDDFRPLMRSLSIQAIDYYNIAHDTVKPHVIKIREIVDPYFQEVKVFANPFLDQVWEIVKPHLDKARLFLKPYSKKVVRYYKRIKKSLRKCHSLIQTKLHETMNGYELTKPLAEERRVVWFLATILMSLPIVVLFGVSQGKEPKKQRRSTKTGHTRRRVRKVRPEN